MHKKADPAVENGAVMEITARAATAHPDGVTARERDDAAFDCHGNGRFAEHGEPSPLGLRPGWDQGAQAESKRLPGARGTAADLPGPSS